MGRHALAQLDALARGYAEKISRAPDEIVLEFGYAIVGVDDLPHHFDDAQAARFVERAIEQAGEMIDIDRLLLGLGGLGHKLVGRRVIKLEATLDDRVQLAALDLRYVAVDRGGMDEQRRRRQTIVVVFEPARMLVAAGQLGHELLEGFEHPRQIVMPWRAATGQPCRGGSFSRAVRGWSGCRG